MYPDNNQNINTMKSEVFKSAWSIFRMKTVSFSEALKEAWKLVKNGLKCCILKMNKQIKSERWIGFETVYYNALQTIKIKNEKSTYSMKGAGAWYDGKTFNND